MSISKRIPIICPKCNNEFETVIWETINTDYSATVVDDIISGDLFIATCPKCNSAITVANDMLYHDLEHQLLIYVLHPQNGNFEDVVSDFDLSLFPDSYTSRVVFNYNQLAEKLLILKAGRDDRIVELAKYLLAQSVLEKHPDFKISDAVYDLDNEREMIFFLDSNSHTLGCSFNDHISEIIQNNFRDVLSSIDTPWQIIDANWARQYIIK